MIYLKCYTWNFSLWWLFFIVWCILSNIMHFFSLRIYDGHQMLFLQSEGSAPKVHKGDGWICWLHVLPYKWIWLVSQRAASIREKVFFGMKLCTAVVENNITGNLEWANEPVFQKFIGLFRLYDSVGIYTINYVGRLNFSREMHPSKRQNKILFKHNNWQEFLKLEHACNLISTFEMHIYCALKKRIACQIAPISGALLIPDNWSRQVKTKPQKKTCYISFYWTRVASFTVINNVDVFLRQYYCRNSKILVHVKTLVS